MTAVIVATEAASPVRGADAGGVMAMTSHAAVEEGTHSPTQDMG